MSQAIMHEKFGDSATSPGLLLLEKALDNKNDKIKVVTSLLDHSPDCKEILTILDQEIRAPPQQVQLVWKVFEKIISCYQVIEKCSDRIRQLAEKLISRYTKFFYGALNANAPSSLVSQALSLLTSIANIGQWGVKDIATNLDVKQGTILNISRRKGGEGNINGVHSCYVLFWAAMFENANDITLKNLIEAKGLSNGLFNRLLHDHPSVIFKLLHVLNTKVAFSTTLPKKSKVLFFNANMLTRMSDFLSYVPTEEQDQELINNIQSEAAKLLNDLCTSNVHGIRFSNDAGVFEKKTNNPVLLQFISTLTGKALDDANVFDIIVKTINSSQDLVRPYFKSLKLQLEPRMSVAWMKHAAFLTRLLDNVCLPSDLFKSVALKHHLDYNNFIQDAIFLHLPSHPHIIAGLNNASKLVVYSCILTINKFIARALDAKKYLHDCGKKQNVLSLCKKMITKLPDVTLLVSLRKRFLKNLTAPKQQSKTDNDEPSPQMLFAEITNLITKCQHLNPGIFTQSGVELSRLLTSQDTTIQDAFIQRQVIEFLMQEPNCMIWSRQKRPVGNLFTAALQIFTSSTDQSLSDNAFRLIQKMLTDSNVADSTIIQLSIWFDVMKLSYHTSREDVLMSYIHDVCSQILTDEHAILKDYLLSRETNFDDVELNYHGASHGNKLILAAAGMKVVEHYSEIPSMKKYVEITLKFFALICANIIVTSKQPHLFSSSLTQLLNASKLMTAASNKAIINELLLFSNKWFENSKSEGLQLKFSYGDLGSSSWTSENYRLIDILISHFPLSKNKSGLLNRAISSSFKARALDSSRSIPDYLLNQSLCGLMNCFVSCHKYQSSFKTANEELLNLGEFLITMMENIAQQIIECNVPATDVMEILFTNSGLESIILEMRNCTRLRLDIASFLASCLSKFNVDVPNNMMETLYTEEYVKDAIQRKPTSKLNAMILTLFCSSASYHTVLFVLKTITASNQNGGQMTFGHSLIESCIKRLVVIFRDSNQHKTVNESHADLITELLRAFNNTDANIDKPLTELINVCPKFGTETIFKKYIASKNIENIKTAVTLLKSHTSIRLNFYAEIENYTCIVSSVYLAECICCCLANSSSQEDYLAQASFYAASLATKFLKRFCSKGIDQCENVEHLYRSLLAILKSNKTQRKQIKKQLFESLENSPCRVANGYKISLLCHCLILRKSKSIEKAAALVSYGITYFQIMSNKKTNSANIKIMKLALDGLKNVLKIGNECNDFSLNNDYKLVTSCLKRLIKEFQGLDLHSSLLLIEAIVEIIPFLSKCIPNPVKAGDLYNVIWQHSMLMKVMTSEDKEDIELKTAILKLLIVLVELDPKVCNWKELGLLVAMYNATLSKPDQLALKLIQQYEQAGISLLATRSFLWGRAAMERIERQEKDATLLAEVNIMRVIETLDPRKLLRTAFNLPLAYITPGKQQVLPETVDDDSIYDPAYLLSIFSALLGPGCVVDVRKFIESGCLCLVIGCLSSTNSDLRLSAYHILARFSSHFETSRFREKSQIELFLTGLRDSIEEEGMALTCIMSCFLMKSVLVLLKPENPMYIQVNGYLLQTPPLNLNDLPLFSQLMFSTSFQRQTDCQWILRLIFEGFRTPKDYYVLKHKHVFEVLMSFYNTPVGDAICKKTVLDIMMAACKIHPAAYDLIKNYGLVSWLSLLVASDDSQATITWATLAYSTLSTTLASTQDSKVAPIPQNYHQESSVLFGMLLNSTRMGKHDIGTLLRGACTLKNNGSFVNLTITDALTLLKMNRNWLGNDDVGEHLQYLLPILSSWLNKYLSEQDEAVTDCTVFQIITDVIRIFMSNPASTIEGVDEKLSKSLFYDICQLIKSNIEFQKFLSNSGVSVPFIEQVTTFYSNISTYAWTTDCNMDLVWTMKDCIKVTLAVFVTSMVKYNNIMEAEIEKCSLIELMTNTENWKSLRRKCKARSKYIECMKQAAGESVCAKENMDDVIEILRKTIGRFERF